MGVPAAHGQGTDPAMRSFVRLCCVLVFFAVAPWFGAAAAKPTVLKYFQIGEKTAYQVALLDLAMRRTAAAEGPYRVSPVERKLTMGRGLHYLEKGEIVNVAFLAANREREEKFVSVKVPIMQGIFGYRLFIIRKDNQDAFVAVNSLQALTARHKAGFGQSWADMKILKLNGIPVVGVAKTSNIFNMLSGGRFDYFPRGISEPWIELRKRADTHPDLTVEQTKAFYYPYPVYFYLSKSHAGLAGRIGRGLDLARRGGSFKALFLKHLAKTIKRARIGSRTVFRLKNVLPDGVTAPDTSWWLPGN